MSAAQTYLTTFSGAPARPVAYEFERQPELGIVTRIRPGRDAAWQWVTVLGHSRGTIHATVEPAAQPLVLTTADDAWIYACECCTGEGTVKGRSGRGRCPRCQGRCYDPCWGEVHIITAMQEWKNYAAQAICRVGTPGTIFSFCLPSGHPVVELRRRPGDQPQDGSYARALCLQSEADVAEAVAYLLTLGCTLPPTTP